jgi:hypothetical protein
MTRTGWFRDRRTKMSHTTLEFIGSTLPRYHSIATLKQSSKPWPVEEHTVQYMVALGAEVEAVEVSYRRPLALQSYADAKVSIALGTARLLAGRGPGIGSPVSQFSRQRHCFRY